MSQILILFLLWFAAIGLACYALLSAIWGSQRQLKRRLQSVTDFIAPGEARSATHAPQKSLVDIVRGVFETALDSLTALLSPLWPKQYRLRLEMKVARAGTSGDEGVDRLFTRKSLIGAGAGILALVVARSLDWSSGFSLLMITGATIGGFLLLDSRLDERIAERRSRMIRELPDVIDMLTISVTAGLGFEQAMAKMVHSSKGEVAAEFERVIREVNAGASRKQAMTAMAVRVDVPEMSTFVATVLQAEVFGTPIAAVLKTQSAELRIRRRQRAEEEAAKAPVKMTIPVMLVLLPASMLLLMGPALLELVQMFR